MTSRDRSVPPRLTVGMATLDDFDGVYFTITSLMLHHASAMSDAEIVVVDSNPASADGRQLRQWIEKHVSCGRYVEFDGPPGTAQARNEVFRQARGDLVVCLDCHVLLAPQSLDRLLQYDQSHAGSRDLLTGPLLSDVGEVAATDQKAVWSAGAWGVWSIDPRGLSPDGQPFEIWQQGMGLFSCRRDAWVEFHPEFRGFGGCESYIMEKFRQRGGRVLCCPWLRWAHRFARPRGVPYRVSRTETLNNYLVGFRELGIDPAPAVEHFSEINQADQQNVHHQSDLSSPAVVVGHPTYGGVRLRGELVARHLGAAVVHPHFVRSSGRREVVFAVKNGFDGEALRRLGDRLIYDPLDAFCNDSKDVRPSEYWRRQYERLQFDDILATSPACLASMREGLPDSVAIHLVPHHADPSIDQAWHDPNGPVVYAGLPHFLQSGFDRILEACRCIGKRFEMSRDHEVLRGASTVLSLRLAPHNTALNRECKPQIKLANAAAAGIPAVTTDCPAAVSLYPDVETVAPDFTSGQLADAILRANERPVSSEVYRTHDYLASINRILGKPVHVVYTAIFGGYDELREPIHREPGVQYICFTDNPRLTSRTWQIRYCEPTGNPLMQAKACKILAHEWLDCDASLWIDGRIELKSLNQAFQWLQSDMAFQRHHNRNCIYTEAEHCKRVRRGDPKKIDRTIERYAKANYPHNSGLFYGGIILRRHNQVSERFNREWWQEVNNGTSRDQISLPVVLRRLGIRFDIMPYQLPTHSIGNHRW